MIILNKFNMLYVFLGLISLTCSGVASAESSSVIHQVDANGNGRFFFPFPKKFQRGGFDCSRTSVASCLALFTELSFEKIYNRLGKLNLASVKDKDLMDWSLISRMTKKSFAAEVFDFSDFRMAPKGWSVPEFSKKLRGYLKAQITFALIDKAGGYKDPEMLQIYQNQLSVLLSEWFDSHYLSPELDQIVTLRNITTLRERIDFIDFVESELNRVHIFLPEKNSRQYAAFRNALDWRLLNLPLRLQADEIEKSVRYAIMQHSPAIIRVWFPGLQQPDCLSALPISTRTRALGPQLRFRPLGHFITIAGGELKKNELQSYLVQDPNPKNMLVKDYPECSLNLDSQSPEEQFNSIPRSELVHLMIGKSQDSLRFVPIFDFPQTK